jgi:DNA replication protein DnaC
MEFKPSIKNIFNNIDEEPKEVDKTSFLGCTKCDAGYIDNKLCDCLRFEIMSRKYKNANIDYDFASLEIDEESVTAFLKDIEHPDGRYQILLQPFIDDYIDNLESYRDDGKGIIFNGPVGRGKSLSAMKIIAGAVNKGYPSYFCTIKELFDIVKKSWDDEKYIKLKNHVFNCDFLCVDDLGVEYRKDGSDWALTELDGLMRHRYYKKLVTIFTTNSSLDKLSEKYAERIVSLFHERSLIVPIVSKEDYRPKLGTTPDYMNKDRFKKGGN